MKALIEPGGRIAEVRAEAFPVAAPLFWLEVPDETTTADTWDGTQVVKYAPPVPTVEELAARKRRQIHDEARRQRDLLAPHYPQHEIDTWDQQRREAVAFTANPTTDTPLLTAMAAARGWTVADLAARVLVKAAAFCAGGGQILGAQQAAEDQLQAITTDLAAGTITEAEARDLIAAIEP